MTILSVVMPFTGKYFYASLCYTKNKTVGFVDANAPPSCQIMTQRFGSADAIITVAVNTLKELVYAPDRFLVLALPGKVFLPGLFMPDFTHGLTLHQESNHVPRHSARHPYPWLDGARRTYLIPNRKDRP